MISPHDKTLLKGGTYAQGKYVRHGYRFSTDSAALPWLSVPRLLT
jgi:hypothetical protein